MFGGMRVIESVLATTPVEATIWEEPKWSPHRSARLWKKLRKKTARRHPGDPACFQMGNTLYMHPVMAEQLRRELAERVDRDITNTILGRQSWS